MKRIKNMNALIEVLIHLVMKQTSKHNNVLLKF